MRAEILLAKWKKTESFEEEVLFPSFIRRITNNNNERTGEYKTLSVFAKIMRGNIVDLVGKCENNVLKCLSYKALGLNHYMSMKI